MNAAVLSVLQVGLVIMVALLLPVSYRVFRGKNAAERLQAFDLGTTLIIGIFLLQALILGSSQMIDISLALATFGFIGTLAIARYLSEGRVF